MGRLILSVWETGSWSLKPFVISLFVLCGFLLSPIELSVKLQREVVEQQKQKQKVTRRFPLKRWDFSRLKKTKQPSADNGAAVWIQPKLLTAPWGSLLLSVSGLKVLLAPPPLVCPCLQPRWLLLLVLSASSFSLSLHSETQTSARDSQHFLSYAQQQHLFTRRTPPPPHRLHVCELPTESSRADVCSSSVWAERRARAHTDTLNCTRCLSSCSGLCVGRYMGFFMNM